MNYELIMLQNAKRLKKSAMQLQKVALKMAMGSFVSVGTDATFEHAQRVAKVVAQRDRLLEINNAVQQAMRRIPNGYRQLLKHVYLLNTHKQEIANKYNVSLATVYRKTQDACKSFREQLTILGYDEQWFNEQCEEITVLNLKGKK